MLPGRTLSSVLPSTDAACRPAVVAVPGTISMLFSAAITPGTAASSPKVAAKESLRISALRILSIVSSSALPEACAPGASTIACTPLSS